MLFEVENLVREASGLPVLSAPVGGAEDEAFAAEDAKAAVSE
jgi:hypothetical protein